MLLNKARKKLLVLGSVPPPIGGQTVYFQTLLKTEVANRFDIIFLDLKFASSISDLGRFSLGKIARLAGYLFRLVFILITNRIDLVYAAIQFKKAGYIKDNLLAAVCKLFGKRVVGCIVGIGLADLYDRSGSLMKFFIRRGLGVYEAFTTPSLAMYERYFPSDLMPPGKARVIPFGIFTDADVSKRRLLLDSDPIQVIYYSHFIKSKGIGDLVAAIPHVIKKHPNVNFLFIGAWDSEDHRKSLMKFVESAGIGKFVRFLGVMTGQVKKQYLESSDIFVLPTQFELEGLPLSILEAMSYGCAIIATDHAAISSVVKDGVNGLHCKPNDPQNLALKIMTLMENRERLLKMQTDNIRIFFESYTAEQFGKTLAHEIELLCDTS